VRFRAGGKALLSMYPGKESFAVQIVLSQTDAEQAFSLNLGKKVRKVIEEAHQFHEGRWLFIKVESQQDLNDIQQLLLVKSQLSKNMRRGEKETQCYANTVRLKSGGNRVLNTL